MSAYILLTLVILGIAGVIAVSGTMLLLVALFIIYIGGLILIYQK